MKGNIVKLIFMLFLTLSCNKKEQNQDQNYFNFDDIDYYHKEISSNDIMKEYEKMKESKEYDKTLLELLEGGYPKKVDDSLVNELLRFGFKKEMISKSNYKNISNFFSKNNCDEFKKSACEPIYRDILIFKKEGKIIGIAKVCFRCETAYVIGTKKNWDYFGECNGFEKLQKDLKNN